MGSFKGVILASETVASEELTRNHRETREVTQTRKFFVIIACCVVLSSFRHFVAKGKLGMRVEHKKLGCSRAFATLSNRERRKSKCHVLMNIYCTERHSSQTTAA